MQHALTGKRIPSSPRPASSWGRCSATCFPSRAPRSSLNARAVARAAEAAVPLAASEDRRSSPNLALTAPSTPAAGDGDSGTASSPRSSTRCPARALGISDGPATQRQDPRRQRVGAARHEAHASSYSAARGAQLAYVQAVGVEFAPHNVQVNAIAQNFVDNPTYFPAGAGQPALPGAPGARGAAGRLVAARGTRCSRPTCAAPPPTASSGGGVSGLRRLGRALNIVQAAP